MRRERFCILRRSVISGYGEQGNGQEKYDEEGTQADFRILAKMVVFLPIINYYGRVLSAVCNRAGISSLFA